MFRVTTRADWDGLVSAALLSVVEDVDRYRFIQPGPFQNGEGEVTSDDLIANLPYRKGCAMWFDHHISNKTTDDFRGSFWIAPSAARVIYEYYNHDGSLADYDELVTITDKIDSANLTADEIAVPEGLVLVSMTVEDKRPQDEPYWLHLIKLLIKNNTDNLLNDPQIVQRCNDFLSINDRFAEALRQFSYLDDHVLITDFRGRFNGEPGNRFLAFALYPQSNIWIKATDHPNDPNKAHISVGLSIFNRSSSVNVGELMSRYGGGGHKGAGTCRPNRDEAEKVLRKIISTCKNQ